MTTTIKLTLDEESRMDEFIRNLCREWLEKCPIPLPPTLVEEPVDELVNDLMGLIADGLFTFNILEHEDGGFEFWVTPNERLEVERAEIYYRTSIRRENGDELREVMKWKERKK